MAQRYGGGSEDFKAQAERLAKLRGEREAIIAKEIQGARSADALGQAEARATTRTNENTRARREKQDLARRNERTASQETAALNAESAAIERNTALRERAARIQRAQVAARGARDPLLAQAQAISGGGGGVRQMRQQLGIGYTRASKLVTTLGEGFRPSGDLPRAAGPLTRLQGLQVASERAEADLQTATRELANVRRRKSATDAERLGAVEARDAARAARDAAKLELESAQKLAAARAEASAAVQQVAVRERAAADASRALILHPTAATGVRTHVEAVERSGLNRSPGYAAPIGPVNAPPGNSGAERAYLSTLTKERREYIATLNEQATLAGGRMVAASNASNAALQREAATLGTVSQAMHKHGALTSEFILASARGETTLKELGNQALITAGKFGGWTAAATGLYAAAHAIGQVGHGAIEASSGVNQLQRVMKGVNPDEAMNAFAGLSREFNVPIEVATDAVYRMGQRFHNLPDAVEAARSSLYSFKTGEVDVASSSKNLLAIVSGFGLSAQDLTAVYDQINQAQNTFGIGIQDTEEGLAKSAGAYRNAGGDLNYLLGLFVAIGKATGRSGNEIGTGIKRAVSQIRIPAHIDALKALGIDVDPDNLQHTLKSAIARARSGALKPADENRAASAIFGNQYASLLAPILRDQRNLDKALRDTSPLASQNSAYKELQTTLHSAREQIAALGNGLQRLGDQLARAGAFNLAGALLHGMNDVLNSAEDLLRLYNSIPGPLREGLTLLIEMGVALKALRKFGALEGVAGGAFGSPDSRLKTRAVRSARDFRDNAFDESERVGQRSAAATNAAERARRNGERLAQEAAAARAAAAAAPDEGSVRAAQRANERVVRAEAQHARLAQRAAVLAEEANDARAVAAEADAAYVETQRVHATRMREYVAESRRAIAVETGVPSTKGVETLPPAVSQVATTGLGVALGSADSERLAAEAARAQQELARGIEDTTTAVEDLHRSLEVTDIREQLTKPIEDARSKGGAGAGLPPIGAGAKDYTTKAPRDLTQRGKAVQSAITNWYAGARSAMGGIEEANVSTSRAAAAADRTARAVASGSGRAVATVERAAGGLRGVGVGLAGIGAALGPLDVALLAVLGGSLVNAGIEKLNRDLDQAEKYLDQYTGNTQKAQREFAQKSRKLAAKPTAGNNFSDLLTRGNDIFNPLRITGTISGAIHGTYETPEVRRKRLRQEAVDQQEGAARRQQLQQQHKSAGTAIPQLTYDQLTKRVSDDASLRRRGIILQREFDRRMANHAVEAKILLDPTRAMIAKARNAVAQALQAQGGNSSKSFAESLRGLSDDAVDQQMQAVTGELTHDNSSKNLGRVRAVYNEYKKRYGRRAGAGDPKALQALAGARDAYYGALTDEAQSQLTLANSKTADPLVQANNDVRAARSAVERAKSVYGAHSQQYRAALGELNTARQQQAQAVLANVEADNALLMARAGNDPAAQANAAVQAAKNTLNALRANSKQVDPNAIKNARAQLINAQNQRDQAAKDQAQQVTQLEGQLAQARAGGDPIAAAKAAQRAARQALAAATTRVERLQALVDLEAANNDLQSSIQDQEDARYQYLESLTDDPGAVAGLEVKRTKAAIKGKHGAARYQALAAYNQALRAKRDTDLQAREDDVDFALQMGKISTQDAIDQYNTILKTRNMTKAQKRDLQLRIKQLQDQADQEAGNLDLDVGSIKLPTIYDVRKAFDPIRSSIKAARDSVPTAFASSAQGTTGGNALAAARGVPMAGPQLGGNTINFEITVNDKNAAHEVFTLIDRALKTNVKSKMKSRGHR